MPFALKFAALTVAVMTATPYAVAQEKPAGSPEPSVEAPREQLPKGQEPAESPAAPDVKPEPAAAASPAPSSPPNLDMDAMPSEGDPLAPKEGPMVAPSAPAVEKAQAEPAQGDKAPGAQELVAALKERIGKFPFSKRDHKDDVATVTAYYTQDATPIWFGVNGVNAKGRETSEEIARAYSWGLDASQFDLPKLEASGTEALADAEIKLSLAALEYARHARGGRLDPPSLSPMMDRRPVVFEPKSVLQALAATGSPAKYLTGLHPQHPQFLKLKAALATITEADPADMIRIPAGPDLKVGDRHAQVALVRQRLKVKAGPDGAEAYDEVLADAVRRHQETKGAKATGVIDKKFRAILNETAAAPAEEKRQRIVVNMERWRWMPDDLGSMYLMNNIPEQITRVYSKGREVLSERIVVGRPSTPTPQFSANMQFVIFHPEWGVPDGIKTNEIAPRLKRYAGDGGFLFFGGNGGASRFLKGQGLRVVYNGREVDPDSVDWSRVDVKRYSFIQPSGGRNVLGLVKFRFPNKHDVYMHDTPDKGLFNERVRAYSHGCMRTQNPLQLAEVLLAHDKGWSADRIKQIVARGALEDVKLTTPVPVHVVYFTAEVDDAGKLKTFGDIYGMDSRVASALAGRPVAMAAPAVASAEEPRESRSRVSVRERQPRPERRFNAFEGLLD
jgi:murein L,D-transpeptidase YcbB/YkuD